MGSFDCETFTHKEDIFIPYTVCYSINNQFYSIYYKNGDDIILTAVLEIFSKISVNAPIYLYIHNINFDGALIINSITKNQEIKIECFMNNLNIYKITLSFEDKKIIFKCSYKIVPLPLKQIGELLKISEKTPFPYKFASLENLNYIGEIPNESFFNDANDRVFFIKKNGNFFDFRKESIEYCENDVRITSKFIKIIADISSSYGFNLNLILSAPSLSFNIFIKKYNYNNAKEKISLKLDSFIRPSYHGGRCEVYGNPNHGEKIYHFDFSGMYGQVMMESFHNGEFKIRIGDEIDLNKPGFYWIDWEIDNIEIPVLPTKDSLNGKLMFNCGKGRGCYWYEEIELFINKNGKILKKIYGVEYEKKELIFDSFVSEFKKIREKGEPYKTFGKLMINSLYGRFGMDLKDVANFFAKDDMLKKLYKKGINIIRIKKVNEIFYIEAEICEKLKKIIKIPKQKQKSNVSLSSAISSKARIKLYKAQEDVKLSGGRILYSDTDSIFASYKENVDNRKFGEVFWDISKKDTKIEDAVFISPKTYALKYKDVENVKIKGIKRNSINFDEIKKLFYEDSSILKFNYINFIKKEDFSIFLEKGVKEINLQTYDKRIFNDNKKTTSPIYKNTAL